MLNYTSPHSAGVLGVLVFFTMIFMILFGVMTEIVKVFQRILRDKKRVGETVRFNGNNRTYAYSAILSFGPIILLVLLRSHGVIEVPMWIGVATVMILGCFWVYKKA